MSDTIGGISLEKIMAAAMNDIDDLSTINENDTKKENADKIDVSNEIAEDIEITKKSKIESAQFNIDDNANDNNSERKRDNKTDKTNISKNVEKPSITFKEFADRIESYDAVLKSYNSLKDRYDNFELKLALNDFSSQLINNDMKVSYNSKIKAKYSDLQYGGYYDLSYPIELDIKSGFTLAIVTDEISRNQAEKFVQFLIYDSLNSYDKGQVQVRCMDYQKGGRSFGRFIDLIENNKLFGRQMYLGKEGQESIANSLNSICDFNISKLKGIYYSVTDYNEAFPEGSLPYTLAVYCDSDFKNLYTADVFDKIKVNSKATAISQIYLNNVGQENTFAMENADVIVYASNNSFDCISGDFSIPLSIDFSGYNENTFKELLEKLNKVEQTNNRLESLIQVDNLIPFTKDSTEYLSIPFAYNDEKEIINLEFGGGIQAHALISGSTGSGKSTTLHTIIEQTMFHYHPDDVELWLIDCKGVEFGCYVKQRTPHITVIGQDNSADFLISFVDLLKAEYERRKALCMNADVRDIQGYRAKFGKHSLSRILIVIDEFHNLTQAVQNYSGETNYKIILENLLKETRSMGMTFLFCSQTIATGLTGLTESAKNQIGCRLSMKHEDLSEVAETLSVSGYSSSQKGFDLESVKDLAKGQLVYKHYPISQSDGSYNFEKLNVIWITDEMRADLISKINDSIDFDYVKRDEITHKDSNRYSIIEKQRHPITEFINNGIKQDYEELTIYPAAPTALIDAYSLKLDSESGNNLLIVGTDDNLRESIIITSVMGMLLDPKNRIIANILDTHNDDNIRLKNMLDKIHSDKLTINFGYDGVMDCLNSLKKIKPTYNERVIYLWYGLNKLKTIIFQHEQNDDEFDYVEENNKFSFDFSSPDFDPLAAMENAASSFSGGAHTFNPNKNQYSDKLTYEDCVNILQKLEEYGPDNNRFSLTIYNTVKSLTKSKINLISNYEYIIGLKMSSDDSYDLFGTSNFTSTADENTVVLYTGNKKPTMLRPYIIDDSVLNQFFNRMKE